MPRQFPEERARKAVARARVVGYAKAAKEAGVTERTLTNWRRHIEAGSSRPIRMQTGPRSAGPRREKPRPPATNAERVELTKQLKANKTRLDEALKREKGGGAPKASTTQLIREVARLDREIAEMDQEAAEDSRVDVVVEGGTWEKLAQDFASVGLRRMADLAAKETDIKRVAEATGYILEALIAATALGIFGSGENETAQPGAHPGKGGLDTSPAAAGGGDEGSAPGGGEGAVGG